MLSFEHLLEHRQEKEYDPLLNLEEFRFIVSLRVFKLKAHFYYVILVLTLCLVIILKPRFSLFLIKCFYALLIIIIMIFL